MKSIFSLIEDADTWVDILPRGLVGCTQGFPGGSVGKESACSAGDPGFFSGSGRSLGEGNGYPLQYSCLENSQREETDRLQSMKSQEVKHD